MAQHPQQSTTKKRTATEAGISRIESEPAVKIFKKAPEAEPAKIKGFVKLEPSKKVNFIALNKQRLAQQSVDVGKTRTKSQTAVV